MKANIKNARQQSNFLSAITAILTALTLLTGAIAVPILCRPFYYAHIEPFRIDLRTALTNAQVRQTYDEVLNYCLGLTDTFQLTHLRWSAEGASHFADVRGLFILDLVVAATAITGLAILWVIGRHNHIHPSSIKGHTPGFWAAIGLAAVFAGLGIFAAVDFDRFFTAFHTVFFPGKENWLFDDAEDPVIDMLPQEFFRNCGLLVLALVLASCIALILADRRYRKHHHHIQK